MGEAKRRKQNDPNFGRVPRRPKPPDVRGLVVSPPIRIEGSRLHARLSNLDPQELRFALLFWDRLVWPSSRAIHFASGPDELFLESAGILTRPNYTFGGDAVQGIAKGQVQAYRDLERSEPGIWALAQGENSLLWIEGLTEKDSGATLELHRAIPIPKHDVPLAEILEFKQRRRAELLQLRQHLESFTVQIEASPDGPLALQQRVAEIDQACADLLAVSKEWRFPVSLSNVKASFSLTAGKLLPAVGAGWFFGQPFGLAAASAAASLAGVASALEIKGDFGLPASERRTTPYRYAYHIERELR